MRLSVIIPVFNEEKTIKEIIRRVKSTRFQEGVTREIIVVDDASEDKTLDILKSVKSIKVLIHKKNKGKGAAIKTGLAKSKGEIIIIQDSDLEYNPKYYFKLLAPILNGKYKVVYGSRLKKYPLKITGNRRTPLLSHYLGNKFLSFMTNLLYKSNLSDMETGYKAFHSTVIKRISINAARFEFEPEITAKILKMNYKIHEINIKVNPRGYDEGKKITWKDGFIALLTLIKYKFID